MFSRAPWTSLRYLLVGSAVGLSWLPVVLLGLFVTVLLLPVVIGVWPLMALVTLGPVFAARDRARSGLESRPRRPWTWSRPWPTLRKRETWREFGYLLLVVFLVWPVEAIVSLGLLLTVGTLISTPVLVLIFGDQLVVGGPPLRSLPFWPLLPVAGVLLLVPVSYLWVAAAAARRALVRSVSTSTRAQLGARLVELSRSRARLLDAFEVERKRIERDLHDGASNASWRCR